MRGKATPRKCIDIPIALRTIGYIYRKKLRKTRTKTRFNKTLTAHFNKALTEFFCIHVCAWVCRQAGARASAGERAYAYVYVCVRMRVRMCARVHGLILPTLLYINPLPSVCAHRSRRACVCMCVCTRGDFQPF